MSKIEKVSIIIPVIAVNDYIRESVPKILELDWPDYEIIIFPDEEDKEHHWPKTRIIASGKVGPAEKRDLALKYATGDFLAFLDDDAYPKSDWLKKVLVHFKDSKVAAIGGPAITPPQDDTLQKISGAVFESFFGSGGARKRYLPIGKPQEIFDWPTVNFIIRRDVLEEVGGFDSHYWPGEDTKLCLDVFRAGYKMMYEPRAIVFHHRRSDLLKHFKQIGNYALHRGFFAKIYPETSRKIFYFAPALFAIYILGFISFFWLTNDYFRISYSSLLLIYLLGIVVDCLIISFRHNLLVGIPTILMIFLTHVWYGIKFIQGLFSKKLVR